MYITNDKGELVPFQIYQTTDDDELGVSESNPY